MADECAESSRRSRQCNVKSKNIFCSCAFVFTVVPLFSQLCHVVVLFLRSFSLMCIFFAVVQFFCCFAICIVTYLYLVFLPKKCYNLSIVTRTVVLTLLFPT
jgi:uncharacterized membrane protein